MRNFNYNNIKENELDIQLVKLIAAIYKENGKEGLYIKQKKAELSKLIEIARIKSTQASNAIEGIVTTETRMRALVQEKIMPKNRDEQEIAGYRDVLNIIIEDYDIIPLNRNYILQLHKILYSHMNNPMAGKMKDVHNYISTTFKDGHTDILFTPLSPVETPFALDKICEEYNKAVSNELAEPLLVISVFIHDFLCIHPFNDGNGRMSRLLTTLLLLKNGFYVAKYISLEEKIAKNKDLYYDSLYKAQERWEEGKEDPNPFIKYLLGTILSAYKDLDDSFKILEDSQDSLSKVRLAINSKIGRFTKKDIRDMCPYLSLSSIEGALRKLVFLKEINREGKGKNICYYKIDKK